MPHQTDNRRKAARVCARNLNITGSLRLAGPVANNRAAQQVSPFELVDMGALGYRLQTDHNPGLGNEVIVSFDEHGEQESQTLWNLFHEVTGNDHHDIPLRGVVVWRKPVEAGYEVGLQVNASTLE